MNILTYIAGVLPFVTDKNRRCEAVTQITEERRISKQTVCNYLWLYLVYEDIAALSPKAATIEKLLTEELSECLSENGMRKYLPQYDFAQQEEQTPEQQKTETICQYKWNEKNIKIAVAGSLCRILLCGDEHEPPPSDDFEPL